MDELNAFADFELLEPGKLIDDDLELLLVEKAPVDLERGLVPAYEFMMRHVYENKNVGRIAFRVGLTKRLMEYGGHIGYEVHEAYRGRRYAARSCKLLFPFIKRHNIDTVVITCEPSNIPSVRTCEIIGGKLDSTYEVEISPGVWRTTNRYKINLT